VPDPTVPADSLPIVQSGEGGPSGDSLPVRLLHDRLLVEEEGAAERKSSGGILIPATAQVGKRLAWARVVAVGANVRTVEVGDRVLFEPEDRSEVELHGATYVLLRERDVHAVASSRVGESATGLYL
jgi:chaperonin GroES